MRALASFIFTSLDGFYEGPDGEIDWPVIDGEFNEFATRQLDGAGTICFGRATYQHMADFWPTEHAEATDPGIATRMNEMEKLVFSRTLEDAPWSGARVVTGDAVERVTAIKQEGESELPVLGSAHLTAAFVEAGVLEELRIMVCPVVLGQGRSLFEDLGDRVPLTLVDVRRFGPGNLVLSYRPSPRPR